MLYNDTKSFLYALLIDQLHSVDYSCILKEFNPLSTKYWEAEHSLESGLPVSITFQYEL